jgi:negative regulator of sigma E activity
MENVEYLKAQISAMVDNELSSYENAAMVALLSRSPKLQQSWNLYHVIGEVIRAKQQAPIQHSIQLCTRIRAQLGHAPGYHLGYEFNSPVVINTSGAIPPQLGKDMQ